MAFAQLTYRESLRDIETCLRASRNSIHGLPRQRSPQHAGRRQRNRDWRIYADFAHVLIAKARALYADERSAWSWRLTAYAFDSTTIDLCLTLFPWAHFRRHKSAVKMHTLLDLRGSIPTNVYVTGGAVHEVNILDQLLPRPALFICSTAASWTSPVFTCSNKAAPSSSPAPGKYRSAGATTGGRCAVHGLRADQTIQLTGPKTARLYPDPLRRIHYFDAEKEMRLVFLTNNFLLPALTIAELYRARWRVELFFRWIKQHLHIKAFFGTSENAVKTQIWVAITIYVLVAMVRKEASTGPQPRLQNPASLSITLFEKSPLLEVLV